MFRFLANWLLQGKIFLLITVWLLILSNQTAKADTVDVVLSQVGSIDVCGDKSDKDIIILISIGRVLQSDSLFGFNFEISYDSVKFKFHSPVYLNTLAEFFDIKDVNFGKKGLVRGYASVGLLGSQISGNRPLIGIYGDYLGSCADSSEIKLNYIEFTDEFKKVIRSYKPTMVQAVEVDKPNRYLKTDFELNSISDLRKDTIIDIKINLEMGTQIKLDTATIVIKADNKKLIAFEDFELSKDLEFISNEYIDSSFLNIKFKFNNNINQFINLKARVNENKTDSSVIKVNPIYTNYCSCVKRFFGDSIIVRSKEKIDTPTVVSEENNRIENKAIISYYDNNTDSFILNFKENISGVLKLYNLCGLLINEQKIDWSNKIYLEGNYLNNGIYLGIINTNLKNYKIILIKN
ncbi:MAG: hypothetical protein N2319_04830 [Candidatus Kapabacteria bacterium]|nr:hypothetical protein [Candidatus Kapabacteria bacterium]